MLFYYYSWRFCKFFHCCWYNTFPASHLYNMYQSFILCLLLRSLDSSNSIEDQQFVLIFHIVDIIWLTCHFSLFIRNNFSSYDAVVNGFELWSMPEFVLLLIGFFCRTVSDFQNTIFQAIDFFFPKEHSGHPLM